ncbi:MAG: hypothetical protein QOF03_484 [Alphaproteobacteria bacterium]|jgi:hypothetical protein|nr:hypothetical protein [Alphaproteobacteria bacterium]
MTAISELVASERAKRYRDLAREARVLAARSKHVPRYEMAYTSMAAHWDELALEAAADAQAERLPGVGSGESSAMTVSPQQRQGMGDGSVSVQRPGWD